MEPNAEAYLCVKAVVIDAALVQPRGLSRDPRWLRQFTPAQLQRAFPVLRVFGTTPAGQKACVHLHHALPYLYVPCPEGSADAATAAPLARSLWWALELALDAALRGQTAEVAADAVTDGGAEGGAAPRLPRQRYIFDVEVCWRKPAYGFCAAERPYFRIRYYNPAHGARMATLLASGRLPGLPEELAGVATLQPHESHLSYLLQAMTDHGIAAFAPIALRSCKFRRPLPSSGAPRATPPSGESAHPLYSAETVPSEMVWELEMVRESTCDLELDAWLPDDVVAGYHEFSSGSDASQSDAQEWQLPTLRAIWEGERARRQVPSCHALRVPIAPRELVRQAPEMPDALDEALTGAIRALARRVRPAVERTAVTECSEAEARPSLSDSLSSLYASQERLSVPQSEDVSGRGSGGSVADTDLLQWLEQNRLEAGRNAEEQEQEVAGTGEQSRAWLESESDESESFEQQSRSILECTQEESAPPDAEAESASGPDAVVAAARPSTPPTSWPLSPIVLAAESPRDLFRRQQHPSMPPGVRLTPHETPPPASELQFPVAHSRPYFSRAVDSVNPSWDSRPAPPSNTVPFLPPAQVAASGCAASSAKRRAMCVTPAEAPPIYTALRREMQNEEAVRRTRQVIETTVDSYGRVVHAVRSVEVDDGDKGGNAARHRKRAAANEGTTAPPDLEMPLASDHQRADVDDAEEEAATASSPEDAVSDADPPDASFERPASPKYDEPSEFWSDALYGGSGRRAGTRPHRRSPQNSLSASQVSSGKAATAASPVAAAAPKPLSPAHSDTVFRSSEMPIAHVSVAAVESLSLTREHLLPDPQHDSVAAVAVAYRYHDPPRSLARRDVLVWRRRRRPALSTEGEAAPPSLTVMDRMACGLDGPMRLHYAASEAELLDMFTEHIRQLDPDFLVSYKSVAGGVAYLLERAAALGYPMPRRLSRLAEMDDDDDLQWWVRDWERDTPSGGIRLIGRHVLDVWRVMRSELRLRNYSFEVVAAEVLGRKMPRVPTATLTAWLTSHAPRAQLQAFQYTLRRCEWTLDILDALDVIGRTGELARIFGIDFMSVLTRGSQYRVESLLSRLARANQYVLLAPTAHQVRGQRAIEYIPLVMEPEARHYSDPVLVLDFQSLYPSMIIAHNICFSTCIGRILGDAADARNPFWDEALPQRLGVLDAYRPDWSGLLRLLRRALRSGFRARDHLQVLPNQTVFVRSALREGLLPRMLREILETRMMLKKGMEEAERARREALAHDQSGDALAALNALLRLLNSRQFGMKYIANVTYGYTSASFSGRMPCAEIADAIVSCGRDAMQRTAAYVERHWGVPHGARVVYGDTDSIFVHLPRVSQSLAFELGAQIAERCTALFPDPVRLKLEKVYSQCFLLAKKRYVGWAFESPQQRTGVLDAKGIETVRRDSCGVAQKVLEGALRMVFERTTDMSLVKAYVQRQMRRVVQGRMPLGDLVFCKEVQLGAYKPGYEPPAALVAMEMLRRDPRATPEHRERVPYLVVYGGPDSRLRELVLHPLDFLEAQDSRGLRVNATYYIKKQILPALERCLALMGVGVWEWYRSMPRPAPRAANHCDKRHAGVISSFLLGQCPLCHGANRPQHVLCDACERQPPCSARMIARRLRFAQRQQERLAEVCAMCSRAGCGLPAPDLACENLECAVFFERRKRQRRRELYTSLVEWMDRAIEE